MTFNPDQQTLTEWAGMNLYDAVMRVRAGLDGSADPIDPAEARVILDAVFDRMKVWRPTAIGGQWRETADEHFRQFVLAAAWECEGRLGEAKP